MVDIRYFTCNAGGNYPPSPPNRVLLTRYFDHSSPSRFQFICTIARLETGTQSDFKRSAGSNAPNGHRWQTQFRP